MYFDRISFVLGFVLNHYVLLVHHLASRDLCKLTTVMPWPLLQGVVEATVDVGALREDVEVVVAMAEVAGVSRQGRSAAAL